MTFFGFLEIKEIEELESFFGFLEIKEIEELDERTSFS